MGYLDSYNAWLTDEYFDEQTRTELKAIAEDDKEIEDRFYKNLAFGTGGLRGMLGAGTNRMNIYTVSKATQGLANYILKQGPESAEKGVVIAHDSRRMSPEFCLRAALVLNGNGIKTYVFDALRPTPLLSFAVRRLGCAAGIVITASHNPKDYNGYKVYWSDGGQVVFPMDEAIIDEVNAIEDFRDIKVAKPDEAESSGLFLKAGPDIDDAFTENVLACRLNPDIAGRDGISIVYTPFNGAGNLPVRRALAEAGYAGVHVVAEQEAPDPDFSTVHYPNPEDPKAFALALKLAKQVNADIVLATDPDSDRLGCMVKHSGEYVYLTGNMIGTLLAEYMLSQRAAKGALPAKGALISTIVSTRLTKEIALTYGMEYIDVLTGFKYIAEIMRGFETSGGGTFVFGFEESIGFLAGDYTRDKDAVSAALLVCEAAVYYKNRDMTLCDGLDEMYEKYGYYIERTESVVMKGLDGLAKIITIMTGLRNNPPHAVGGAAVLVIKDCKTGVYKDMTTGEERPVGLPASDVFYCEMEGGGWFCIRPSGTEPKIKIYCGVKGESSTDAKDKLNALYAAVMETVMKNA